MIRNKLLTAAASLAMALLVSCGEGTSPSNQIKAVLKKGPLPDMSVQGPVLNVSLITTIDNLDPQTSVYGSSFEIIGSCMEGLFAMAADGSSQKALAKTSEVSPDGLIRTYTLRQDAYWANGDPVTAHDFVYAWQRAVDPEVNSEYSFMMSDIAQIKNATAIINGLMSPDMLGVRAIDDFTLKIELLCPVSYFDDLLYFSTFYPANKKFVESCKENYGKAAQYMLSNGPFILTEFESEKGDVKLIKNTAYYDAANIKIAGIHYILLDSYEEAMKQFNAGKIDIVELKSGQVAQYQNDKNFHSVPTGFLFYLCPNVTTGALQNQNLRRALNLALDRDELTEILNDGSKASLTCVPAGYAFNSKGQDFSLPGAEFPEYADFNPDLARQYLELAKKELGTNTIEIEFMDTDTESERPITENIKNQFERNLPGLKIKLRLVPRLDRRKIMRQGNFELGLTNWGPDYADPMTYLSMWLTGNDQNNGRFSDPKYDSLIANCTNGEYATQLEKRWNAMKDAERIIMEKGISIPMYVQCNGEMIQPNVKGIEFHAVAINRFFKNVSK